MYGASRPCCRKTGMGRGVNRSPFDVSRLRSLGFRNPPNIAGKCRTWPRCPRARGFFASTLRANFANASVASSRPVLNLTPLDERAGPLRALCIPARNFEASSG